MSCRSYTNVNGVPVAVEVEPSVDIADVERELRRVYGSAYRLARLSRRGRRWQAEIIRAEKGSQRISYTGPDWLVAET